MGAMQGALAGMQGMANAGGGMNELVVGAAAGAALPDQLVSAALSPDEVAVQNDMKKHLVSSIQELPLPQREAMVLCFEGFSYGEMSEVLGISTNAAMLRCQRAKASLKAMLDRRP